MSYQSMKAAFLNLISRGQRERVQAKEAAFDPAEFERTFWAQPNDVAKYVYFRSQPFAQADALLNASTVNWSRWVNAMSLNALLGGFNAYYLRWTPQGIIGPNGPLPRDAKMTWAGDGTPAFNGDLTKG
jgi:hypothetical protein